MAGIKEELALLVKLLGKEDAEARQEEGGRLLKEIERAYNERDAEVHAVNKESATRKEKIRELSTELETANIKIKELGADETSANLKQENESLKAKVGEWNKSRRESFISSFPVIAKHPDFERVKTKLVKIPVVKDGETPDFKDVSDEDIFANQAVIQEAQGYGLFGQSQKPPNTSGAPGKPPLGVGAGRFDKMGGK